MDTNEVGQIANYYGFRPIKSGESEHAYRQALARFLHDNGHIIEAHEVASGKRWDEDEHTATGILGAVSKAMQDKSYPVDELGSDYAAGVLVQAAEQDDLKAALDALGSESFAALIAGMFGK